MSIALQFDEQFDAFYNNYKFKKLACEEFQNRFQK